MLKKGFFWVSLSLLIGCQNSQPEKPALDQGIFVQDFRGQNISLSTPAKRVVCLIESALSGIYMLGAEEQVIGISTNVYDESLYKYYSLLDHRIAQKTLPAPGNWDLVSMEQVLALRPDLVIIWSSQTETILQLESFNIPVYGVMLKNFADVIKEIEDLGTLLGKQERAQTLIELSYQELNTLRLQHDSIKKSAFFAWPQGINHTSGTESTVNDVFEFAGVSNNCPSPEEHVTINLENLIRWNPDLIVMWPNFKLNKEDWEQNSQLQSITAIHQKQIFELPNPFLCDLWTLKLIYAAQLINHWAYHPKNQQNQRTYRNQLFNKLYPKQINWIDETQ